ncbi:unnamed protein product [Brassica napus]|uniref:(rape) hypothetical protein n=1 Tax=Brassica napus TaxID=3708 RepID=A0A816UGR2_BRANA|nr:unnamed protein product [Brassica napus]
MSRAWPNLLHVAVSGAAHFVPNSDRQSCKLNSRSPESDRRLFLVKRLAPLVMLLNRYPR